MTSPTPNRWNLLTNSDLTAEPVLPAAPANLAPSDVPTRLAARAALPGPAAPDVPNGLSAMGVTDRSVQLYWSPVQGATRYRIYSGASTLLATTFGVTHNYAITQLAPATAYSLRVAAVGVGGESAKSPALDVTTLPAATAAAIPPYAPPGLVQITSVSGSTINLSWNPVLATPPVTSYEVWDGATLKGTVSAPTTTAAVLGVPRKSYSLTVRGVNSAGSGPLSSPAVIGNLGAATAVPAKTSGLALNSAATATTVPVRWTAVADAETYKVYDGATLKATVTAPATSTTLTGYTTGTGYSITVKAGNSVGDGTASTALTGTTP